MNNDLIFHARIPFLTIPMKYSALFYPEIKDEIIVKESVVFVIGTLRVNLKQASRYCCNVSEVLAGSEAATVCVRLVTRSSRYSKTCLKQPKKTKVLTTNGSLMKVESIAEYFRPSLSDNWS